MTSKPLERAPLKIALRQGAESDTPWLYQTFKRTMREYIDRTWGWDELLQSHSFADILPAKSFIIAAHKRRDVAALNVREKTDHLWLEMILVLPELQGHGIGKQLLEHAQALARMAEKPLRLSVLRVNPAQHFYRHMGFVDSGDDEWSFKMEWLDQA